MNLAIISFLDTAVSKTLVSLCVDDDHQNAVVFLANCKLAILCIYIDIYTRTHRLCVWPSNNWVYLCGNVCGSVYLVNTVYTQTATHRHWC